MRRLGIRELRASLAGLVRQAGTGERMVVTVDGRPVAQLGPLESADHTVSIDDLGAVGTGLRINEPAWNTELPSAPS